MAKNNNQSDGPKKMYRSGKDKIISGVCGGIAEYFNVDPVWIRLLTVLIALSTGVGIIIYIVAWIIMPVNPEHKRSGDTEAEKAAKKIIEKADSMKINKEKGNGRILGGVILVILGVGFLFKNFFHWFSFNYVWPILLIAIGLYIMLGRRK